MEAQSRKLFGTDGIRGIAGEFPLDPATVYTIGRALGRDLAGNAPRQGARGRAARVVLGQDTRESSEWIANALGRGLAGWGIEVASAGVITTPGIAYLTRAQKFDAGIVISASHNPWTDNGIKIFGADGYKLSDAIELDIEREIFAHLAESNSEDPRIPAEAAPLHSLPGLEELRSAYLKWLQTNVGKINLAGNRVIVDCAHGAACALAQELFRSCGINAEFMHSAPNGRNINENCGALHPEIVAQEVERAHATLGVTFDGDADRALFADRHGKVVNGDAILLVVAREMKRRGRLAGNTVVATTMSNMGLEIALRTSGIRMLRAPVGDKYVLDEMKKTGATLGGEQSGHIIFGDGEATTGDGLLTALRVLEIVAQSGKALEEMIADLHVFPQVIRNIRVREKRPFAQIPEVAGAIADAERELDGNGRVVVRYSGTEALARVMIEAESEENVHRLAGRITEVIAKALGI